MKKLYLIVFTLTMTFNTVFCQNTSKTNDSEYYNDWEGMWYEVVDGKTNEFPSFVVTKSLYDSAFEEVWMQGKGGHYGKAWRAFDGRTKKWDFAWISTDGLFQLWEGKKIDDIWYIYKYFVLDNGEKVLSRQAFIINDRTHMTRTSEHSRDEGKTWALRFKEEFVKK